MLAQTRLRCAASDVAGNVARFLGREHQARGRHRPPARLVALPGEGGLWRRVIAGQGPGEADRRGIVREDADDVGAPADLRG